MNKNRIFSGLFLAAAVFFLASCAFTDQSKAAELEGIWADEVNANLIIQLNPDGSARIGGDDIYSGMGTSLNWTVNDFYLDINGMAYLYSSQYVYELSLDGNTLYLYMTKYGMLNTMDDPSPGDTYVLTRQPDGMSFYEVESSLDTSSSYYYW